MRKSNPSFVADALLQAYPDARCSLLFASPYECLVAVMLSAQCTDKKVNTVTPALFSRYPDCSALSKASLSDLEALLRPLGLAHSKAKNLKSAATAIAKNGGDVPSDYEQLLALPGVGNKTARVTLMEAFGKPSFPVDTHVARVSKRLGLAPDCDSPKKIEERLEILFPASMQPKLHHCFISLGRDICRASKPLCEGCPLKNECLYFAKKSSLTMGK
jgi:endonuclease III